MTAPEVRQVDLKSIVFDEHVYPRKHHDPGLVQRYALVLDEIEARQNYMSVAADMTLLDGRHRHLAYLKNHPDTLELSVPVYCYPAVSDEEKLETAIDLNSSHGQQLSSDDKQRCTIDLYRKYRWPFDRIARVVSVRKEQALAWTKDMRAEEERRQNETIFARWLACDTNDDIGKAVDLTPEAIGLKVGVTKEKFQGTRLWKLSEFSDADDEDGFQRPLYNVWTFSKKTNDVSHFGNSEQRIVENLLYLYTEPFDIVVDPFAGGASTIDVCKKRLRRYWVSDRKPIIERETEIRRHDLVTDGVPPLNRRWSDVSLTYLDPPYWRQAAGQYSDDPTDLANMSLEAFTTTLGGIVKDIGRRQSKGVIALLIQPTQWLSDERAFSDHVTDLVQTIGNKRLALENRVSCPYPTQQYNAQQVEWAKEHHKLLVITRELIVWRVQP